jgi:hypothetical protein
MSELRAVLPADAKERYQQGLKNTYTWNVSNGVVLRPEMPPGAITDSQKDLEAFTRMC